MRVHVAVDRRERVELTDNIKSKQELLQQRKVELESLHVGVDSATEQREKLERDREEARALVDQLNTEVRVWLTAQWWGCYGFVVVVAMDYLL